MAGSPDSVPWRGAWQVALYGSQGFYRRPEGPAGHFTTSAVGIPHATPILSQALINLADRHQLNTIVDFAAGGSGLIGTIAELDPSKRCVAVDITERPPSLSADIEWWRAGGGAVLPTEWAGLHGCLVIAHEWLDVVPCPVAQRDERDTWRLVLVDSDGAESLGAPVSGADLDWLSKWVPDGVTRAEVGNARDQAWNGLCAGISDGLAVAIDYGHEYAERPVNGTLIGFRQGRAVTPLLDGSTDITAHVAVDSLAQDTRAKQREILADLLPAMALPSHALASTQPAAYLQGLATHGAWTTLRAPGGLGEFWWVQRALGR
ncbi:SAM-dependent methyltransferase [Ornithinimicrobium sp. Arc0846-15]|nr:SAM-dependent methyltransferase [Ornithinimicrobium laminariae]